MPGDTSILQREAARRCATFGAKVSARLSQRRIRQRKCALKQARRLRTRGHAGAVKGKGITR